LAKVLIIEDYPPLAKVIAIGLRRSGHEVERAGSAQRALETPGLFDLIIVDVDLPDGNGIDVAEQLLNEERAASVVFFSATRDADLRARALGLGPFIDKNESVETLLDLVKEELEAKAALARAVGAPDAALLRATARSGTRRRVR
jgi:DNA-binding response OmpR family regulator